MQHDEADGVSDGYTSAPGDTLPSIHTWITGKSHYQTFVNFFFGGMRAHNQISIGFKLQYMCICDILQGLHKIGPNAYT